eukprot:m51a1_g4039 hypothetical protein (330) ;mRNA; f:678287-679494
MDTPVFMLALVVLSALSSLAVLFVVLRHRISDSVAALARAAAAKGRAAAPVVAESLRLCCVAAALSAVVAAACFAFVSCRNWSWQPQVFMVLYAVYVCVCVASAFWTATGRRAMSHPLRGAALLGLVLLLPRALLLARVAYVESQPPQRGFRADQRTIAGGLREYEVLLGDQAALQATRNELMGQQLAYTADADQRYQSVGRLWALSALVGARCRRAARALDSSAARAWSAYERLQDAAALVADVEAAVSAANETRGLREAKRAAARRWAAASGHGGALARELAEQAEASRSLAARDKELGSKSGRLMGEREELGAAFASAGLRQQRRV